MHAIIRDCFIAKKKKKKEKEKKQKYLMKLTLHSLKATVHSPGFM